MAGTIVAFIGTPLGFQPNHPCSLLKALKTRLERADTGWRPVGV